MNKVICIISKKRLKFATLLHAGQMSLTVMVFTLLICLAAAVSLAGRWLQSL